MKLKFKKLHPDAVIPTYGKDGDAGADLTAISINETPDYIEYGTGLAIEFPPNTYGAVVPRSSISKYDLIMCNAPAIIDENYRGEIKLRFKVCKLGATLINDTDGNVRYERMETKCYKVGDRIGQLILKRYEKLEFEEVEELSESNRMGQGFGSSGN